MLHAILVVTLISALTDKTNGNTAYRLNTPIKPSAYSIAITPYFDTGDEKAFTFDGEVEITFTTEAATRQIKLHSEDLTYDASNITVMNEERSFLDLNATNPLVFDEYLMFAFINLDADLQVGVEYNLKIFYRGPIRDDLFGFYRSYYIDANGVKKWVGSTQLEATHARKVFPSFDEPALKATLTLTIDRPEHFKPTLANTKLRQNITLDNGYVREIFHPSPIMPTYLVAFVISELEGIETVFNGTENEFGIFTRPEALNQTDYSLDFGIRVIKALGDYYGIDYYATDPNLKLDHVAIPDFMFGAMENWGLALYREALFLYVPEESTPFYKYRIAQNIAHESAHFWFGNLVTCHWWSDTWLQEGFANYFQDYITSLIEPDVGSANMIVIGSVWVAFDADSISSSLALSHDDINSRAEIDAHFGLISYQKGGSIVRMMHHLMGDDAFKLGIHTYLDENKFSSGYPINMYEALDFGASYHNALAVYPDTNMTKVMSSWIVQPGYPILHVEVNEDNTVVLTQKRFYSNSKFSSNETYNIPITFTTQRSPDFENTKPAFIMENTTHVLTFVNISQDQSWILFNIQETGFYRVNYDDHTWQLISNALKGNDRARIHYLNRAQIVNDLFAFFYADVVKFDRLMNVLDFLKEEDNFIVWSAAISGLNKLWNSYLGSTASDEIQNYALRLLDAVIDKLGYEEDDTDDIETLRNRMQVLEFSCKLDHAGCIENFLRLFRGLRENGTKIAPSLRPVAYCTGLRFGDASDYDFVWNLLMTSNVANDARIISDILGCTSDEDKIRSYLVSMLVENSPIRNQDLMVPLTSVLSNYSKLHIVMDELQHNYTLWTSIYRTMDGVLSRIASTLRTEGDFTAFESFLDSCSECTEQAKASAKSSLAAARESAAWADSNREDILKSLRGSGVTMLPSMMMITVVTVFLRMLQ